MHDCRQERLLLGSCSLMHHKKSQVWYVQVEVSFTAGGDQAGLAGWGASLCQPLIGRWKQRMGSDAENNNILLHIIDKNRCVIKHGVSFMTATSVLLQAKINLKSPNQWQRISLIPPG